MERDDDERSNNKRELRGVLVSFEPLAQRLLAHVDARNGDVQGHDVHMPEILPHLLKKRRDIYDKYI